MNDADRQAVKEIVADALAVLREHPSHWCTGHGFGQVAAKLRKPTTRKAVTYTQITDGPELPKAGQWIEDSEGSFEQVARDFDTLECLIFTRTETPVDGKETP